MGKCYGGRVSQGVDEGMRILTLFISSTFHPVERGRSLANSSKRRFGERTGTTSNIKPDESLGRILASLFPEVRGGEFEHRSATT